MRGNPVGDQWIQPTRIVVRGDENMHLSDVSLNCAQECASLAAACSDVFLAKRLTRIALRLHRAAVEDAELCGLSFEQERALNALASD